jgi:hypothetical protein
VRVCVRACVVCVSVHCLAGHCYPWSSNGRAVKRTMIDEKADVGRARGGDGSKSSHVCGQDFGGSDHDEIRLEIGHDDKEDKKHNAGGNPQTMEKGSQVTKSVGSNQNHDAGRLVAAPLAHGGGDLGSTGSEEISGRGVGDNSSLDLDVEDAIARVNASHNEHIVAWWQDTTETDNQVSSNMRERVLKRSWRASVGSSTSGLGNTAFSSSLGRKARSRSLGALFGADDSMEIHFCNAEEARQVARRLAPRYVSLRCADTRSPWRRRLGGNCLNLHHRLFWFEKNGPKVLLRLMRYLLLGSVIMLTIALEVRLIMHHPLISVLSFGMRIVQD